GEEAARALKEYPGFKTSQPGKVIGHHEAAGGVERDFRKAEQLDATEIGIEIAAEANGALFLALNLRLKLRAARKAEAGQAVPASVMREAEDLAVARCDNRFAKGGRQHESALLAPEREALADIDHLLFSLHLHRPALGHQS